MIGARNGLFRYRLGNQPFLVGSILPACMMPFLIRRMGVAQAAGFGLDDTYEADSPSLLHKRFLQRRRVTRTGVARVSISHNTSEVSAGSHIWPALGVEMFYP